MNTIRVISALILREMSATYGKSMLGYLWAIFQPIGSIAMFTLVISIGLRIKHPGIGTSFILFYASGFFPYSLAMDTAKKVSRTINYSKALLKYPTVTYVDAIFARIILNTITSVVVYIIIFTGIIAVFSLDVSLNFEAMLSAIWLSLLFGAALGTLNCFLFYQFPAWSNLWAILTRPLFLLSTIIYSFEQVPSQFQHFLTFNPLIHMVGLMRRGIYVTYDANYVSELYIVLLSLPILSIGLLLIRKFYKRMLYS